MQPDNYKSRAQDVRRSARSHLQDLREARLARRKAQAPAPPADDPAAETVADTVADTGSGAPKDATPVMDAATPGPDDTGKADDAQTPAATEGPDFADDPLEDMAVQQAALADLNDDGSAGATATPASDAAQDAPADPGPDTTAAEDSPLAALPGAGPGLIWMLHQCGITTLQDLAAADAEDLSTQLGVVGQILDVRPWIEIAKRA